MEDKVNEHEDREDSFESEVHSRMNLTLEEGEVQPHRSKKWMKVIIALGIALLLFGVLLSLTNFTIKLGTIQHMEDGKFQNLTMDRKRFQFDDIFSNDFRVLKKTLSWIHSSDDDGIYSVVEDYQILLKSVASNSTSVLVNREIMSKIPYFDYSISSDMKYVLFSTNGTKLWRYSYTASYFVLELKTGFITPLTHPNYNINFATWSPTGHSIAFVKNNNVYVNVNLKLETQITFDGSSEIFNGVPDWIYEEEVYQSNRALWWSPDSSHIAFLRFDESEVPEYRFPMYHSKDDGNDPYLEEVKMRYPKPGFPNPIVSVLLHNILEDQPPTSIIPLAPVLFDEEDTFSPEDTLIVEVVWVTDTNNHLMVRMMNRVQDKLRIFLVDVKRNTTNLVRTEDSEDGAWIETHQAVQFIPANEKYGMEASGYIDIVNHNGYNHYAIFSPIDSKNPLRYLTQGNWEVVDKHKSIDTQNGLVYYISTERGSVQRHLYSITIDGKTKKLLTPGPVDASYDVTFSPKSQYYLLHYQGPDIPWQKVKSTIDSKFVLDLEDNRELKKKLSSYDLPKLRYTKVKIGENEFNALETAPPDFEEGSGKRYNVLFNVYGGPGSQLVSQAFKLDFHTYLVSNPQLPMIVVTVDGRGTGFKGQKFRTCVAQNLGDLESQDQIEAARYWGSLGYVNSQNLAIWGWSFGGFLTSKIIESNSGVFKLGIAVAPVTNWRFYDSIYTERYMKTPQLNPDGYKNSAVKNMTGFHNAQFLLVHGTGDDNVHFQNSAYLVDELTRSSVRNYRVQFFTDSDHSISKNNAHREIYSLLSETLNNTFQAKAVKE
ncbi:Dipeptidyl peptidase 4 [Basidiobolus ranarum]|uniref:Dipeptidyl peptidase 4 n=1 Tax=Basidiobolus ranarum TaxID=34480 RepID=A0ABR2W4X2_9FUNG